MLKLIAGPSFSFLWRPDRAQWRLRPDGSGERAAHARGVLFVIGRALDCQLVLPDDPELRKTTSRWHCHIVREKDRLVLVDGSPGGHPETGGSKPSVSGTWLNGRKLSAPQALKTGDKLVVGPWTFAIDAEAERPVDIDGVLSRLGSGKPRKPEPSRRREAFARLHELSRALNQSADVEANLVAILECVLSEIPGAGVAAILSDGPGGACRTRIAWQRYVGRITSLRFSSDLVRRLPQDRSCLFEGSLAQPTTSQREEGVGSALLVPLWSRDERLGILYLDNRGGREPLREDDLCLADVLASHASLQLLLERQAFLARVEGNMAHYFGSDVVQSIMEQARLGRPPDMEVRDLTATVLFIDLEGFSAFCRGRAPREISGLLNPFLQLAAEGIQRHQGYVDKFLGDGVLGVFGAQPLEDGREDGAHAAQAVKAAKYILASWAGRSLRQEAMLLPMRLGLDTGQVVVGNIGYPGRMEYSVLGDAVNLASRLEKLANPNGIVMTQATKNRLGGEFSCADGGSAEIKGFGAVRLWRLEA